MFKKIIGLSIAALLTATSAFAFTDTNGHWAEAAIEEMAEKGYVNGVGDGLFAPDRQITEAEFAKLLCSIYNLPSLSNGHLAFTDVSETDWFKDYALAEYCVANPKMDASALFGGNAVFNPNRPVSRKNAAYAMLCIYGISSDGAEAAAAEMKDFDTYEDTITIKIVGAIVADGLMKGDENGCFNPEKGLNRAELCTLLKRAEDIRGNKPCDYVLSQLNKVYSRIPLN